MTPIDILDRQGIFQGSITVPVRLTGRPVVVRGNNLVTVVYDTLGVNYVARFRVRKS
jgi:hypothetical protein